MCSPISTKPNDSGQTWQRITAGIPAHDFTRVIREDPARRGLLYAGTETGVYISFDDGASWQPLRLNLAAVPVYDLIIKEHELVTATHGRSCWILDDLTPMHQFTEPVLRAPAHLFPPDHTFRLAPPMGSARQPAPGKSYMVAQGAPATYSETPSTTGQTLRTFLDAGKNPPDGAIVTYYLRQKPEGELALSVLEAQGQLIKRFSSVAANNQPTAATAKDPRVSATPADFAAQFSLLLRLRDKLSETHEAINRLRSIRPQVEDWIRRAEAVSNGQTAAAAIAVGATP